MSRRGERRQSPRVELYQRVVAAIHDGTFPPGQKVPPEPELAAWLGVSRPALREVLILLQEDGVITRRQGAGSTINQPPSKPGLERLLPVEALLGAGEVRCHRRAVEWEKPTDFSSYHLRLAPSQHACFWETIVDVDGVPACFAHEWATDDEVLRAAAGKALTAALRDPPSASDGAVTEAAAAARAGQVTTMLAAFLDAAPGFTLTARSTLGATALGKERGQAIAHHPDTSAMLLTQVVSTSGHPVMAAKYLFPAGAPLLAVTPRR